MSKIVNLKRARKQRAQSDKRDATQTASGPVGVAKGEKDRVRKIADRDRDRLDQHRRDET